jgi:cation diffusion facilitator CzcD-associated flavoprotein CzcO
MGKIRLNTEVVGIDELEDGGWKVVLRDWSDGSQGKVKEEVWDAVVLATCWYDDPVYPTTEGMQKAKEKGLVKHAKWWRGPKAYEGKVHHAAFK